MFKEWFRFWRLSSQALLTHYALHDKDGHMVSLTWGLMEAKKQIYISGHIKSVQSDSPFDKSGGVCFVDAGPITEYMLTLSQFWREIQNMHHIAGTG